MNNNLKSLKENKIEKKSDLENQINTLELSDQLNLVLTSPWEKRFDLITSSVFAPQLVANMPVEELFWTIKATGVEDSGVLLNMATPEQLQFIFDLDWWHKDNLRPEKIAAWLLVMYELAEGATEQWLKWILSKDPWLFPAMLHQFITVVKRPDDMDIQEAKDVLPPFTLDNVYYLGFKKQKLAPLFSRLITHIVGIDPGLYRDVLETMLWETPSQNLETAYRLRCGRLGDLGIPDYYESLNIYVPLKKEEMHRIDLENSPISNLPVSYDMPPFVPTLYISGLPALEEATLALVGEPVMERIIREITGVANKILMADLIDLDEPDQLKGALQKAMSLLNLGIELLSRDLGISPRDVLRTHYMEEIVRLSSGLLLPIGAQARQLVSSKTFKALPHHLKPWLEAASKRPSEVYDEATGHNRFARSLADVDLLKARVDEAKTWEKVLEFLLPPYDAWPESIAWERTNFLAPEEFSVENALVTAVANLALDLKFQIEPLNSQRLEELGNKLDEIGLENLPGFLEDILEPMTRGEENSITRRELKETVIPRIVAMLREFMEEERPHLSEPQFIKNLLVEVS
ncbi:MAG: hypothetical protein GXO58_10315 [Thermodesulfobacteria bacterium]|nr:hypothetical protein [Thermodesulfobacteriota bacterium]